MVAPLRSCTPILETIQQQYGQTHKTKGDYSPPIDIPYAFSFQQNNKQSIRLNGGSLSLSQRPRILTDVTHSKWVLPPGVTHHPFTFSYKARIHQRWALPPGNCASPIKRLQTKARKPFQSNQTMLSFDGEALPSGLRLPHSEANKKSIIRRGLSRRAAPYPNQRNKLYPSIQKGGVT